MGARPRELLEIDLHFPTLGEYDRPRRDLARLSAYISADGEGAGFPKEAASQCSGKAGIESRGGARVRETICSQGAEARRAERPAARSRDGKENQAHAAGDAGSPVARGRGLEINSLNGELTGTKRTGMNLHIRARDRALRAAVGGGHDGDGGRDTRLALCALAFEPWRWASPSRSPCVHAVGGDRAAGDLPARALHRGAAGHRPAASSTISSRPRSCASVGTTATSRPKPRPTSRSGRQRR